MELAISIICLWYYCTYADVFQLARRYKRKKDGRIEAEVNT